jgi:hypothetical protein
MNTIMNIKKVNKNSSNNFPRKNTQAPLVPIHYGGLLNA